MSYIVTESSIEDPSGSRNTFLKPKTLQKVKEYPLIYQNCWKKLQCAAKKLWSRLLLRKQAIAHAEIGTDDFQPVPHPR